MDIEKRSRNKSQIATAAEALGMAVDTAPYSIPEEEWVRVYGEICGKSIDAMINADTRFVKGTADGLEFDGDDVFNSEKWFSVITGIANGHAPADVAKVTNGRVA